MTTIADIQARFDAEERARRSGFMPDKLGTPGPVDRPREEQRDIYDNMVARGYSPEMGNILARHGVSAEGIGARPGGRFMPPDTGPLVARGETATTNQAIDFGAMEARYNQQRVGNITGARMDQGAMGMTRDLRGMAGQGMTNEAQDRFMANREADWSSRMDRNQRDQFFNKDDATKRFDIQSQADAKASELALRGELLKGAGWRTSEGGREAFIDATGQGQLPPEDKQDRPLTAAAKLVEDFRAGRIDEATFNAERDRRIKGNPAMEGLLAALMGGGAAQPGTPGAPATTGGAEIVKWTKDGKKVVSRDGGKTFNFAD
jgi:hypothetical protein